MREDVKIEALGLGSIGLVETGTVLLPHPHQLPENVRFYFSSHPGLK